MIEVTDKNFQKEVIEKSKKIPVLVDFWSEKCPACLILGPILEKLNRDYEGKFVLAKANVNQAPIFTQKYQIMSIPANKLFKKGLIIDEFVGALPEPIIKQWLDKNL